MIQFLLNQQKITLDDTSNDWSVDTTVLDYLREERNLCGTKEGCASGDCGACTVVVVSLEEDELNYQSINSCITFLGALHGMQLITVEHLAENDVLHPVQQAMVDHHGSQCGFCTPGFVMSMFSLYKNQPQGDNHIEAVHQSLAGNLCRCTGYRPIVDAAIASTVAPTPDQFSQREQQTIEQLRSIAQDIIDGTDFMIPNSLEALSDLYDQNPNARLLGGGTDLALEVTQQLKRIDCVILLKDVVALKQINISDTKIEIGAAVNLAECDRIFKQYYSSVSKLLHRFGSTQIRNQGTIGGNIANASPIGDLPPVLIALNAELTLYKSGVDRVIPIEEFFLGYKKTVLQEGELIRLITIPLPKQAQNFFVYKISKRLDDDISAVCMAINALPTKDALSMRIAVGGMAAIPKRASHAEAILCDYRLTKENVDRAKLALAKDFSPISDARASAAYRLQVTQNLLDRFYHEMTDPRVITQVSHVD